MKICHFDFSAPLELYENAAVLVCENPQKFLGYCNDFLSQQQGEDGDFIIEDNRTSLSFKKSGKILFDLVNLSLSDKKIVAGLYEGLAQIKEDSLQQEYVDLVSRIISFVDELAVDSPMAVDYNADFDFSDILKALKVSPKEENISFVDTLVDYLDASAKFLGTKFFVLVNARTFLCDEEFCSLLTHIGYAQYGVLFLERTQFSRVKNEKVIVIDNDLCEILVDGENVC